MPGSLQLERTTIRHRIGRGQGGARSQTGPALILLLPFFVLFAATLVVPVLYAVGMSLFTTQRTGLGFGGAETVFAGIGNYVAALTDPTFQRGFAVLGLYCLFYIPTMIGLALIFALALDSLLVRARRFFQLALFLPHVVPHIIAAIIWAYLYTPGLSPVLKTLAGGGIEVNLLSQTYVLPAIVNIAVWEWTGYNVVIFFTALQAVDRELLEAARVDGARGTTIARRIKIPLIRPAIAVVVLFTIIGSLQLFTEPVILSSSSSAVSSTFTPNMYAYHAAFTRTDPGLAAAASVILALAAAVLSFAVTRWYGRRR